MDLEEAQSIAAMFERYIQTDNHALIENYSAIQLKQALQQLSSPYFSKNQWHKEMERRIGELEEIQRREKLKEENQPLLYDQKVAKLKNNSWIVYFVLLFAAIGILATGIASVKNINEAWKTFSAWTQKEKAEEMARQKEFEGNKETVSKIFTEFLFNRKKINQMIENYRASDTKERAIKFSFSDYDRWYSSFGLPLLDERLRILYGNLKNEDAAFSPEDLQKLKGLIDYITERFDYCFGYKDSEGSKDEGGKESQIAQIVTSDTAVSRYTMTSGTVVHIDYTFRNYLECKLGIE